ncbi:hypothetical protein [Glycomyces salinus]|nr:hypothetical protein [Glycomyces salinus]
MRLGGIVPLMGTGSIQTGGPPVRLRISWRPASSTNREGTSDDEHT